MQVFPVDIAAGETKRLDIQGTMFRLFDAVNPVDVEVSSKSGNSLASQVGTGYWTEPTGGFDNVSIKSANAQTVKIGIAIGRGGNDSVELAVGSASVIADNAPVSVETVATLLIPTSGTRRAARFFNAGTSTVFLGGNAVTTANAAIRIEPGQLWIEDDAPQAAWYGISVTAGQSIRVQELS